MLVFTDGGRPMIQKLDPLKPFKQANDNLQWLCAIDWRLGELLAGERKRLIWIRNWGKRGGGLALGGRDLWIGSAVRVNVMKNQLSSIEPLMPYSGIKGKDIQYSHLIPAAVDRTSSSAWFYKHPWITSHKISQTHQWHT